MQAHPYGRVASTANGPRPGAVKTGTSLGGEIYTKETTWLIYGLNITVLEKKHEISFEGPHCFAEGF